MKVLYDHQIFENQDYGGISRYFTELIQNNPSAQISLKYSDNIYLKNEYFTAYNILPKDFEYDKFFNNFNFKGKRRLFNLFSSITGKNNKNISIKQLKKSYDIFHPTYYDTYFLRYLIDIPFVLAVYDMIHELFPNHYNKDKNIINNKKILINKSKCIIAISENTKKDIIKLFPDINEDKIHVVFLGSSFPILNIDNKKDNYILYTGGRWSYKNFENFIRAAAPLLLKYGIKLICTGSLFNENEIRLLNELNIINNVTHIFADEKELVNLYKKAIAFIFPSFYEGFGIPVLEAFSSGCPALLSNTSSLPEVGGNAALYFDPNSINDIRKKIDDVICSPALQKELTEKGIERAKLFSWEKCVKETIDVYNNI